MKTFMVESKATKIYPTPQTPVIIRPVQTPPSLPKHNDIARRAYEIYLEMGCGEGQSEQNWRQAEHELRNEKVEAAIQR